MFFANGSKGPEQGPVDRDGFVFETPFIKSSTKTFKYNPKPKLGGQMMLKGSRVSKLEQRSRVSKEGVVNASVPRMLRTYRHKSLGQLMMLLSEERINDIERQRKLGRVKASMMRKRSQRKAAKALKKGKLVVNNGCVMQNIPNSKYPRRKKSKTHKPKTHDIDETKTPEKLMTRAEIRHKQRISEVPSWILADDRRKTAKAVKRMEKHFEKQRRLAQLKIKRIMEDNELSLVKKMAKWSLLR